MFGKAVNPVDVGVDARCAGELTALGVEQAQAVALGIKAVAEKEIARAGGRCEVARFPTVEAVVTREDPQATPLVPTLFWFCWWPSA